MQTSTLSSKNQITVPSRVRRQLQLASGDRIRFASTEDGRFIVEAVPPGTRSDSAARRRLKKVATPLNQAEIDSAILKALREDEIRSRQDSADFGCS